MIDVSNLRPRQLLPLGLLTCAFLCVLGLAGGARQEPADFTFNNGNEVSSLDPATLTGLAGGRIARAIFEGLIVFHPSTLAPLPGSAESWDLSPDGCTYTFHMQRGASWSNGDPLTAHDFVYSFRRLLDPLTAANYAYLLWYVKGARAYTSEVGADGGARNEFSSVGIHAADDHTLVIELNSPTPFFLDLVTFYALCPVNRRSIEAAQARWPGSWELEWLRPENIVTNGPFRIVERRVNDRIRLVKSENYWDADNVAMRSIDVLAVEQETTMLNMYLSGDLDFSERINPALAREMLPREDFLPRPYLGTYFYRLNTTRPPFDDVRVRRALYLSLPRETICEQVMGMGQIPAYSLVPTILKGFGDAPAQTNDLDRARELLRAAGFGDGDGDASFPPIEIHYNNSESHSAIAQVVAAAWRDALGIKVKLRNEEWKVFLDTQNSLGYDVSRSSWISDYADPSSFIDVFLSAGENNRTGWNDAEYDHLVTLASVERDAQRRVGQLQDAQAILMRECPILPIFYYVHQNVVAPRLGGFHHNALDAHFPKFLYWMDDAELARKRAAQPADWTLVAPHGPASGLYSPLQQRRRSAR
ncbi:MAG: oligopeptide transport system substrate-binding protein [Chlamydiales bacterium]|jgi:oligopeptide transport system substrate-binding protein